MLSDEKINSLVERLGNLNPSLKPEWGRLSVNGMLCHCNIVTDAIISSTETRKPKFKEILLAPVFNAMKKLPRNFQSGTQFLAVDADLKEFESERSAFIGRLKSLKDHEKKIMGIHPLFGPLNTKQWRKFLLLHTDHHLRQFNV